MATRKKKVIDIMTDNGPSCKSCRFGMFEPGESFGACRLRPLSWVTCPETETSEPHHDPAYAENFCGGYSVKSH